MDFYYVNHKLKLIRKISSKMQDTSTESFGPVKMKPIRHGINLLALQSDITLSYQLKNKLNCLSDCRNTINVNLLLKFVY